MSRRSSESAITSRAGALVAAQRRRRRSGGNKTRGTAAAAAWLCAQPRSGVGAGACCALMTASAETPAAAKAYTRVYHKLLARHQRCVTVAAYAVISAYQQPPEEASRSSKAAETRKGAEAQLHRLAGEHRARLARSALWRRAAKHQHFSSIIYLAARRGAQHRCHGTPRIACFCARAASNNAHTPAVATAASGAAVNAGSACRNATYAAHAEWRWRVIAGAGHRADSIWRRFPAAARRSENLWANMEESCCA